MRPSRSGVASTRLVSTSRVLTDPDSVAIITSVGGSEAVTTKSIDSSGLAMI